MSAERLVISHGELMGHVRFASGTWRMVELPYEVGQGQMNDGSGELKFDVDLRPLHDMAEGNVCVVRLDYDTLRTAFTAPEHSGQPTWFGCDDADCPICRELRWIDPATGGLIKRAPHHGALPVTMDQVADALELNRRAAELEAHPLMSTQVTPGDPRIEGWAFIGIFSTGMLPVPTTDHELAQTDEGYVHSVWLDGDEGLGWSIGLPSEEQEDDVPEGQPKKAVDPELLNRVARALHLAERAAYADGLDEDFERFKRIYNARAHKVITQPLGWRTLGR